MYDILNREITFQQLQQAVTAGRSVHTTDDGYGTLHAAAASFPPDRIKKIKFLIEKGVNWATVYRADNLGTPLHNLIANENFLDAICFMRFVTQYQCARHVGYRIKDKEGKSPLIVACKVLALNVVQEVIKQDPGCINLTDNEGCSALHYACALGQVEIVNELIKAGADRHAVDNHGRGIIHYVCNSEHEVRAILHSISIHPDRDKNATRNAIALANGSTINFPYTSRVKFPPDCLLIEVPVNGEPKLRILATQKNAKCINPGQLMHTIYGAKQDEMNTLHKQFAKMCGGSVIDSCLKGQHAVLKLLTSYGMVATRIPAKYGTIPKSQSDKLFMCRYFTSL